METTKETTKNDTQSKMMATAIEMVGKQVNLNFTIREFAERAGVNLASVNYYFRSKDNLLNQVESYFMHALQETYTELEGTDLSPRVRVIQWAERLMHQLMEYPGILFLMVTKLITDGYQSLGIAEMIDTSEQMLKPIVMDLTGMAGDDPRCSYIMMQLVAGVVTPILFYHGIGKTLGVDVSGAATRSAYVRSLVDKVLPEQA